MIVPRDKVDVVVAEDTLPLEQLNDCLRIYICYNVVNIDKVSAADLNERSSKLVQGRR